jgi:hypothetical protein
MLSTNKYAVFVIMLCFNIVGDVRRDARQLRYAYPLLLPLYSSRVRFDAGGEDCGPSVEVLVVGDVEVGLAKQAGCEACAEKTVDPQCGEHCAVVLIQCRSQCGDFDLG